MKFLISAGPTREPIDPVRFISNRSSGRMGIALAEAVLNLGHDLCLVHGPLSVPVPDGGRVIAVETATEMLDALAQELPSCDVLIMAAAVCDKRPSRRNNLKLSKEELKSIELENNPDLLYELSGQKGSCFFVSFSLENSLDPERPLQKMRSKNSDWVVVNSLSSMDADGSDFLVMDSSGKEIFSVTDEKKTSFANRLINLLVERLA